MSTDAPRQTRQPRQHRRLERPRERVLEEAWALVAERGLADLSLAELGRRLDTSAGHLSYYVGSKNGLLLELLRWSEDELARRRAEILASDAPPLQRLHDVCVLNFPRAPGDPRWVLWTELWPRVLHEPDLRAAQSEYDAAWRDAVASLLREMRGVEESSVDALTLRIGVLMDGLSVALLTGDPAYSVELAWEHVRALLPDDVG